MSHARRTLLVGWLFCMLAGLAQGDSVTEGIRNFERGNALARKGDLAGAVAAYTQAIEKYPRFPEAYNNRGMVRLRHEDREGAVADFTQAIALSGRYAAAYHNRGMVRKLESDTAGALADFTRAIVLRPSCMESWYQRGQILASQRQLRPALDDLRRARSLASGPTKAEIERWIRAIRQKTGGGDQAE